MVVDHLGSVRLVVDVETGDVAQRLDYDALGRVTLNTNPGFQPFGFAGGMYDVDTELVRFGARDYDASTGRWTTKDPMGIRASVTNLYTYALNDPISVKDPLGRQVCDGLRSIGFGYLCLMMPPLGDHFDYELANRKSGSKRCGSLFGPTRNRRDQFGNIQPHKGIDLTAPIGTPILAGMDGKIVKSGWRGDRAGFKTCRGSAANGPVLGNPLKQSGRRLRSGCRSRRWRGRK